MAQLTERIPVRFSEDLAQYAEVRPVRRQPMTLHDLVGLILTTTGKQPERIRDIVRHGTCTYNIYRYWWEGFELNPAQLEAELTQFPDPDPSRRFSPPGCIWVRFQDGQEPHPHQVEIEKDEGSVRRWFRRQSFWDALLSFAAARPLDYLDYSYYDRADLYGAPLSGTECDHLREQSRRLAQAAVRRRLARGFGPAGEWVRVELACRRET